MFSRWPSVCLSVRLPVRSTYVILYLRPSVRTSFPFNNLLVFNTGFNLNFADMLVSKMSRVWIISGQLTIISDRNMVVVNVHERVVGL